MLVRYHHVVIQNPLPSPGPEELTAVEQELGAALPALFAEFLTIAHGGTCDFVFDADGETISLGRIFRLERDPDSELRLGYDYGTILGELGAEREAKRLPKQVLPFAQGGGDVWIYLDLTPEGSGRIVAFLQGLPDWTGLRQESAFVEVAPSFNAFLESLRVNEPGFARREDQAP